MTEKPIEGQPWPGAIRMRHYWAQFAIYAAAVFIAVTTTPVRACGDEPVVVVCKAFHASSTGLTSGKGRGIYRHYESAPGKDWQLKIDANLHVQFEGRKYRVDLGFARDFLGLDARRIIYDGEAIADIMFSRNIHPSGAQAWLSSPQDHDHGFAHLAWGEFPWDVTNLARNVFDPEQLRKNSGSWRIKIDESSDGDLVGTYYSLVDNNYRVRLEWPRRFGFNLARMQSFNPDADRPYRDSSLQWKRDPSGLWYVTSLQETFETYKEGGQLDGRFRAVMMYAKFEPNCRVDPSLFVEDPLRLPEKSRIIDNRIEGKASILQAR
jgi:hypothetical protein